MLDGQGCLFPVRHSNREETPQIHPSYSVVHKTCRAESSAESSPNPNVYPHLQDSRSDFCCPCSLDASESNSGELVSPNSRKSGACHCLPVLLAKVEPSQACDSNNGNLPEEIALPSGSLDFDCLSTDHSSSLLPAQEVEAGASSIHCELDEVDTNSCTFCCKFLEISRSVQAEGSHNQIASEDVVRLDFVEAASSYGVGEEESLGKLGDEGSNFGAEKSEGLCLCKYIEVSEGKDLSCMVVATISSSMTDDMGKLSDVEHSPGLGSVSTSFKDLKEADVSSFQSACTEEILLEENGPELSPTNSASFEYVCATGGKRLRIINSDVTLGGGANVGTHRKVPSDFHVDNADNQQQPYLPGLDNESALRCFAFVPLSDLGRFALVGRQNRDLVKSRLIFKLRRMYGTVEHLVFIYASGAGGWTAYDANRNVWRTLPPANVNPAFNLQDRESLSAGTHVLWFGKEMFEFVYYRYDLLINSWERGPSMVNPRCLFASASCGEFAYVAGGFGPANNTGALSLLNSAERYNSVTGVWERLPPMCTARQKCSGFFMDGKFYVIGGRDANHHPIMSGEEYNPVTGLWRTIPNMYFAPEVNRRDTCEPSPPLVAVVNNQLYAVENTTNILKMYNKQNKTWRNLGYLPVRADIRNGWGVAFKALGKRLFVMGDLEGIAACCWQPGPNPTEPLWELLCWRERGVGSFLYNCAVMTC